MHVARPVGYLATLALAAAALVGCSSAASGPATSEPAPQVENARTAALMAVDDYERAGAAVKTGAAKKPDPGGVSQYFASPAVRAKFQGDGGIDAPMGCKAGSGHDVVDGAVIGTPVAAKGAVSVPVNLYVGNRPAARLTATTDLKGRLTGFSCGTAAALGLPGEPALVGFYGGAAAVYGTPGADSALGILKRQYLNPGFAGFARPAIDTDQATCAEDGLTYWHAVYAPAATNIGAQWYFWPGGPGQVIMSVAVDPTPKVAWVNCTGQLVPPLAPAAYSDDQVESYIGDLLNSYAVLLALKPYGADVSGIASYFATPAAYRTAAASTGSEPLECAVTAAGSINADSVTTSGTTAVVSLTSAPTAHALATGEKPLGHPRVTVNLSTMKIASVTCR
ncbi:hypothetical protein EDD99_6357 [Streptomyces sp. 846.5]|nr:hypothetical protein [Streptomyces sp. 846.5]TDT98142.1 hypothetical protein EDD99_6357 [Streptomyces sp. 846.5]